MKRRYQFGHIFERGKKRKVWVARFVEPKLEQGKVVRVLKSQVLGPVKTMSRSAAHALLAEILKPLNEGGGVPIESASFGDFFEKWERDLLPTYRESTRAFYRDTARRWVKPYFEDWNMAEIKAQDVQRFVNLFAGKYSSSVLKHVRATLRCLFGTAENWRYVREDPTRRVRLPRGTAVKRAQVLRPEQIGELVGRLAEPYRTMVMLASTSGLRESELFGLQWDDFDFGAGVVSVRRRVYRRRVGDTKTAESVREIPLHHDVMAAVAGLVRSASPFVFAGPKGGFLRPDEVLRDYIIPVARELGLPEFTWRSFRRSAESAMHNSGIPLKVQQEMMGHKNPNTTLLYAEADHRGKRSAADALGEIIFPRLSQIANSVATKSVN